MTPNEPFLVLISPSVADLGHAYVIAESINQASSAFADLQQQCDYLQKLARQDDPASCLAVERRVTQWSTSQRDAKEWLVCSALPQDPRDADKIQAVMSELWPQIYDSGDEASATWLKKATQKTGAVFHALRMSEITLSFRSHPQLRDITWLPILPAHSKPSQVSRKSRPHRKNIVVALIGLLAVWGATTVFKKKGDANDSETGVGVAGTVTQNGESWDEWHEVLSGDDRWRNVLEETAGSEAFQAWESATNAAMGEKKAEAQILEQRQLAVKKLDDWMTLFCREFKLSDLSPKKLNDKPIINHLKQAARPWHRNIDNQISKLGPELSSLTNAANDLEEFASFFGSENMPESLRTTWNALVAFSQSNPSDDIKPFQDVVRRELDSITPPPESYNVLTLADAEKVKRLRFVLGSEEFGLLLASGRRFKKEERWDLIKKSLDSAVAQIDQKTGPERALLESLKMAIESESPAKPATPKSP